VELQPALEERVVEASWRAGVEAMRAAVADDPFDEWEGDEVEGFWLEEV